MHRARIAIVALVVLALVLLASPVGAKATRKSFCRYVRAHTFEFTEVFDSSTDPVIAAASSEQEVRRLTRRAPASLQADFKTFSQLLAAIRTQDSDAISAIASSAGAASGRLLDYVSTKCGVTIQIEV